MSILKVENVSFGFGDRTILDKASFVMQKGEHIGLVGLNGEGKSTFINIIMGNVSPDDGKIEWNKRITKGYLDQYTRLTAGLTIKEFLKTAFAHPKSLCHILLILTIFQSFSTIITILW